MIGLVLGAVRARAAQALTVLVLTAIAAAVAAAGPWFSAAAGSKAATSDVANAAPGDRVVSVRQLSETLGEPKAVLDAFAEAVRQLLPLPGLDPVMGMSLSQYAKMDTAVTPMALAYRDGFCDHVRLTGDCPAKPGEVAISQDSAQALWLDIGGTLKLSVNELADPTSLRIVGRYTLTDPAGAYWSDKLFRADDGLDPAFTPLETFAEPALFSPTLTYDVTVPDELIRGDDGFDLAGEMSRAGRAFTDADLRLVDPTRPLLQTIASDRALVRRGMLIALAQVLVLSWFAMGLAGRCTGRDRRGDAALLKLRGSTRGGMLRLAFGQHLVPLLAGVVVGTPFGLLAGWWLGGSIDSAADRRSTLLLCAATVAAVLVGGLLVLAAVEIAVLRLPVAALLRRVPTGRRSWRADLLDLVLLAVAVAATYQARADDSGSGLALIAPALVALAVALLLARVLSRVADRASGAALRTGRLRLGLTAARISRQPGTDRVFTLVTVVVAVFATTGGAWWAGHNARIERSEVELGAPRVLTVQASTSTALQHAVRTADPQGTSAMAVIVNTDVAPALYAVDSTRLGAVAGWRPEYGDEQTLSKAVATALPAPATVTGDRLELQVRNDGPKPVRVAAVLQNEDNGHIIALSFGLVRKGEHTITAKADGCTAPGSGCRLVRWTVSRAEALDTETPSFGASLTLTAVRQRNPDQVVLDAAALGDVRRWRADFTGSAMQISAAPGALTMRTNTSQKRAALVGTAVYAADATLPLPVILAGAAPNGWQFGDPLLYAVAADPVPVRVVASVPVLPAAGRAGLFTNLDTIRRVASDADLSGTYQVWLAAGAPASVVDRLKAAGLVVTGDNSVAGNADRLAEQGTAQGAMFALFAAAAAVLLAAATIGVAVAADREPHLEQLRALRQQGLPARAARRIGTATSTVLVVAAVLAGLLAAAIARPVAGLSTTAFTDGWNVTPPPGPLSVAVLAVAGVVALLVFVAAARLSLRRLTRELGGGRTK
ncbi:ABC transporter permease [Actinoplanes sp. TFC3]|uniref:ABC transporter permease n=1 Tax=Actinoplanes sp. TFC3 TaxID=1710355 RepID=UPI0008347C59|nr:ABC transporter permease [Actinoplanes sp. TFC3]